MFCFKCFSKMGQQMLERKKEGEVEEEEEEEEKQPRQTVYSAVWAERKARERRRVGKIEGRDAASTVCFGLFFLTQHFLGQRTLWPLSSALLKIQYLSVFSFKNFLQCLPSDLMLQTLF